LSEIAPNFGRFLLSQILLGAALPKVIPTLTHLSRGASHGKVSWGYLHYPQSYRHTHVEFQAKF